jgi:hypothetical protein
MDKPQTRAGSENEPATTSRREFLQKSVYAAYATPFIASLLVARTSAAISQVTCEADYPGGRWIANKNCCSTDNNNTCEIPGD